MNKYETADITGLLQVALIVLKLCKVINWSWWWVLLPTWLPIALLILICIAYLVMKVLDAMFDRS